MAAGPTEPEIVGSYEGYTLVRHRRSFYGIPWLAGPVDLSLEEECRHAGVVSGRTRAEVQERIARTLDWEAVPVEFAGWLPIFERSGNCGRHPQFKHTASPPPGYRFTCSAPLLRSRPSLWQRSSAWLRKRMSRIARGIGLLIRPFLVVFQGGYSCAPRAQVRVLAAMIRLFFTLWCNGAKLFAIILFLRTRHYQSQLLLANYRGLVFLPSMPFTYGQNPWVIEIEDPTTLFYPFIHNGQTRKLRISRSSCFPIIKTLLESDQCSGIITHMKSTAEMISTLFGSDKIKAKVFHVPLGVRLPQRWQRHEEDGEHLHLLFINSWHQLPVNFYIRGGLDVMEAFAVLRKRYPQLRLTLRTHLPGLHSRYRRIIEEGWVRVIDRVLTPQEMDALFADSHIFLLPAARVHIVSLLQAMSYGLAVVASDGWGFKEYLIHERNGLVVEGRYGKVSWVDEKEGMLREYYDPMHRPDPKVVRGLVAAVSRLVEDRGLRKRLGRTARLDVETTYSLERWNSGLKEVFDKALSPSDQCSVNQQSGGAWVTE